MSFPPNSPLYLPPDGTPVVGRTMKIPSLPKQAEIEVERIRPAIKYASSKEDDYRAALVEIRTLIQDYEWGLQPQDAEDLGSEVEAIISQALDRG